MPDLLIQAPAICQPLSKRRHASIGGLLAILIIGSWSALHIATLFLLPLTVPTLLLIPCLTWLSVGLFIVSHDSMHGTLTPGLPRANRILGAMAALLYANFSYRDLQVKHLQHHTAPGNDTDPDFYATKPAAFWPWYLTFMRRYFGWRELMLMTARIIVYLLLGAPLINIMVFYAVPAWLSSAQLFYFGTYRPHRHEPDAFNDHHNARSSAYPLWISLLTCFHFGYHHEHHLSPGTPWWRLPTMRTGQCATPNCDSADN